MNAGFEIYNKKSITIKDPRSCGIISDDIKLAQAEPIIE